MREAASWEAQQAVLELEGETVVLRERRGNAIWSLTVFPIRFGGEIRFAAGQAREITAWGTAEQELRHTVLSALKAQEFERNMVARFLHDTVGQNLTALGLQLARSAHGDAVAAGSGPPRPSRGRCRDD